jgi:superfamily II DNA or RNA helicase
LEQELAELDSKRAALILKVNALRNAMASGTAPASFPPPIGRPSLESIPSNNTEKVALFLKLFRGREDVFPKRWENPKTGKSGYSPACRNEWVKPICQKPQIKCGECKHQNFPLLDEAAIEGHLKGPTIVGTYAIREDDTCTFLACDFDESGWKEDALAYQQAAREIGIEVSIERSRSGNGAHAWIFFDTPVPARLARSLGTLILAKCSELNIRLSLDSYDRLFPSQDYLPRGGFGNLIALPLQRTPREAGNSCFLDSELKLIGDQWAYLSQVRRISERELREVLNRSLPAKPSTRQQKDGFDDISWITDQAILDKTTAEKIDYSIDGQKIEINFGAMLSIPLEGLPGKIVAKLKKTASFPNPRFYEMQRMRMQTYPHPRFIFSGELRPEDILLPRGVLDDVVRILTVAGAKVIIRDERIAKRRIKVNFHGELTEQQKSAVKAWKTADTGILMAPPGAGKTVMGCAVIAERKVSTLVLVHRQEILSQWKARITQFLGIPAKEIGVLSGTKKKLTGQVDLVMLQTLAKLDDFSEIADRYSQIIIDECHHIPAVSFAEVLKQLPARYVLGLTATPYRKDGLEKILFQQCGPIRHEILSVDGGALTKAADVYETGFRLPENVGAKPPYHVLVHSLVTDKQRNFIIANHAVDALMQKRFPLLVSDRKEHLELLDALIKERAAAQECSVAVVRLASDMSAKARDSVLREIKELRSRQCQVILLSTGSLIGEGFDLPELDTLILTTPLSFEGRMIQYAGRLHRLSGTKSEVQVIDFVDSYVAICLKMYRNRVKAYRKMGYQVTEHGYLFAAKQVNLPIGGPLR